MVSLTSNEGSKAAFAMYPNRNNAYAYRKWPVVGIHGISSIVFNQTLRYYQY